MDLLRLSGHADGSLPPTSASQAAAQAVTSGVGGGAGGGAPTTPPPPLLPPLPAEQARVHGALLDALAAVASIAPAALQRLLPSVVRQMPHPRTPCAMQVTFHGGMFRMAEHAALGALRDRLLAAAVDHLIALDVEVRWEELAPARDDDDDLDGEGAANVDDEEQFELEFEAGGGHPSSTGRTGTLTTSGMSGGASDSMQGGGGGASADRQPLDAWAGTLDALMGECFMHLSRRAQQPAQLQEVFATLMRCFETTILPTYQSKFTQFLLFVTASADGSLRCARGLVRALYERLAAPQQAPAIRQAAAAYLGSYLARAAYLSTATVAETVKAVIGFAVSYARECEVRPALCVPPSAANGDAARQNALFYASMQAALYALCYRLDALLVDGGAAETLRALPLQQLVDHPLAPLAGIMPDVADEFARRAAAAGLADCTRALAQRDELLARANAAAGNGGAGADDARQGRMALTCFKILFPFDPYRLKNSYKYVKDLYVEWPGGDDEEEDTDAEDVDTENGGGSNTASQLGSLQQSVGEGGMSLTQHHFSKMVGTWRSDGGTASGGGTPIANGTPLSGGGGPVDICDPMALSPLT